jgi:chemotaxis signal transduction protein
MSTRRSSKSPVEFARDLAAEQALQKAAMVVPADTAEHEVPLLVALLMFRIGAERFAVELTAVEEIIDRPAIFFVPEMPPAMAGVMKVRGAITPVYSASIVLETPLAHPNAVLIFQDGVARMGVLIDDVVDAISLDMKQMQDTPAPRSNTNVVLGVALHDHAFVTVLDVAALMAACKTAAPLEAP